MNKQISLVNQMNQEVKEVAKMNRTIRKQDLIRKIESTLTNLTTIEQLTANPVARRQLRAYEFDMLELRDEVYRSNYKDCDNLMRIQNACIRAKRNYDLYVKKDFFTKNDYIGSSEYEMELNVADGARPGCNVRKERLVRRYAYIYEA